MCNSSFCNIIPPELLSQFSKEGSVECKNTLADLGRIRQKRATILANVTTRSIIVGNGDRFVYDSENTAELRKELLRKEGQKKSKDEEANKVYEISGFVREYFSSRFQLNSLDNNGIDIILNIHYRKKYNNAFWDGDEMAFGDGDGTLFNSFTNSIDVIAHELVHGITQFLANLEYFGQSGAMNEHFSDVFGTVIKQAMLKQSIDEADWLIGNDVIGPKFPGKALRSMSEPGTAYVNDPQPDHMDNYFSGPNDNQGVHINSGILNKAFYLASMRLGIDHTSLIWFECLKKLWATAQFKDMLDVILKTSSILSNQGRVPSNSTQIIEYSFAEVGLKKKHSIHLPY